MQGADALFAIAEISIGLAGSTGIVAALYARSSWHPLDQWRTISLLIISFGTLGLALLPFGLYSLGLDDSALWRATSAIAVTIAIPSSLVFVRLRPLLASTPHYAVIGPTLIPLFRPIGRKTLPTHQYIDLHRLPDRRGTLPVFAFEGRISRSQRHVKWLVVPWKESFRDIIDIEPCEPRSLVRGRFAPAHYAAEIDTRSMRTKALSYPVSNKHDRLDFESCLLPDLANDRFRCRLVCLERTPRKFPSEEITSYRE